MWGVAVWNSWQYSQRRKLSVVGWPREKSAPLQINSVTVVRERSIPTKWPLLAGEVSANFADRECRLASVTDPYYRILAFLDRSRYYFLQVAPQLYSRGWVDRIPDSLLLRKCGSAGNRNRDLWICSQELWPLDHGGCSIAGIRPLLSSI
jgi:hypothetical protein